MLRSCIWQDVVQLVFLFRLALNFQAERDIVAYDAIFRVKNYYFLNRTMEVSITDLYKILIQSSFNGIMK